MENRILITGFGGQGILFAGKFLAHIGIHFGRQITWMPSYGPETRGGTSYCGVTISDGEIYSPIVTRPNTLICMNAPSLDKFENAVEPGGLIVADSSLIDRRGSRADVREARVPATKLADANGIKAMANMIAAGKMIKETGLCGADVFMEILRETVSDGKKALLEANMKALELGYNWE